MGFVDININIEIICCIRWSWNMPLQKCGETALPQHIEQRLWLTVAHRSRRARLQNLWFCISNKCWLIQFHWDWTKTQHGTPLKGIFAIVFLCVQSVLNGNANIKFMNSVGQLRKHLHNIHAYLQTCRIMFQASISQAQVVFCLEVWLINTRKEFPRYASLNTTRPHLQLTSTMECTPQ